MAEYYRDELQANVLVFDYRGYGRSDGKPNESGVTLDAMAARKWLSERVAVNESDIVLVGRSLGGGVATSIAANIVPKALVLQNTFTSLPDVAAEHYPWLPVQWVMRNRFDSISKIKKCTCPIFQSHGTSDEVVDFELAKRLYEQANSPKEFFQIDGGTHNDVDLPQYFIRLRSFLERHCY
jgi:fermentation-respiration switch protein FrsA (DUF1100 family)